MYLDWKPGDRLVCVDATPPPLMALWFFRNWIRSGQSYTMRQLIIPAPGGPNPGPGVYLAEIRNPIEPESGFEYGYLAYRFEKLEEGTVALPVRAEPLKTAPGRARTWSSATWGRRTLWGASTLAWGAVSCMAAKTVQSHCAQEKDKEHS